MRVSCVVFPPLLPLCAPVGLTGAHNFLLSNPSGLVSTGRKGFLFAATLRYNAGASGLTDGRSGVLSSENYFMPHRFRYRPFLVLGLVICLALLTPLAVFAQTGPDARSQQVLEQLANGDPLQQEQASQELAAIASPALVPDLTRIFRAADNPRPAAAVLGAVGTPAAMAVLVSGLADEELTPRRNAAQRVLLEMEVEAVPALMVGLSNQSPQTRRHAATVLGFIKSPRAGNSLLRVAQSDEDARVRQEAVWALGEIGEARMMPALKAISRSDPDLEVRIEAERAMLRAGGGF